METAGSILISGIIDGENGTNGYNTAVVQLFRRYTPTQAAPTPALPNGALTYTFSTGKLAGSYFNGWSQNIPSAASGGKLFVTMATARSQEATDSIAQNEWATPVEYVTDGANGEPGISQAPVIIYKRSATQPTDKPADGAKYYFKAVGSTKAGSLVGTLNGWSTAIPANTNGLPCWTRQATAVAPATADYDEIAASEWSDPATKLVEDGAKGVIYALVPSVSSVVKKKDGSYSVSVVSCTRQKNVGGTITNNTTDGTITCRIDGGDEVSYTNNDEIPVSAFAKSVQFIFKVDGVTVDTETVLMIVDGKDNVEYKISLAGSVLAHDPNTGKLIVSIKGRVYKVEGDTTTPYTALTKDDLYLYFEDAVGDEDDVPTSDFNVSGNGFSTTYHNGDNYSDELFFGAQFKMGGKVVARESIQVVKYGTNGQSITGHTGRFFYYAGDYSGTPADYAMQETQGPYAKVTNGTTVEFWMLDFKGVEPASFPVRATEAPSDQSTQWTKMSSQQQYYIARAFFGPYAHLGSFIINGDWMISQFGVLYDAIGGAHAIDSDTASWNGYNKDNAYTKFLPDYPNSSQHGAINFCPNFAVDGKTGKTYQNDAYIRGEVHASSGTIGGFEIGPTTIKSSNGNIVLNSDGSATFKNGDFEVTSGNNSIKINSDGFEAKWGSEGLKVGASGIQRWDSTRNIWAPMYEKKIAKVFKTTTIDLGSVENKSVNYVLNARVDWDNRTTIYLPSSSDVPNGASIIVRGLARDCDANVSPKQGSNDVILAGDYVRSSMEVLAADCAEFIMCKGINTYIRATQYEQTPSIYIEDAWLCNMYDRDL